MESNKKEQINHVVFTRLVHRIYALERENYKTNKLKPTDMVERVRKIIEFEVDKDED